MPQRIEYEGSIHEFPDDFKDQDIARALKTYTPQAQTQAPNVVKQDQGWMESIYNSLQRGIAYMGAGIEAGSNAYGQLVTKAGGPEALTDPAKAPIITPQYYDPATGDRVLKELQDPQGPSITRYKAWKAEAEKYPKSAPDRIEDLKSFGDVARWVTELGAENLPYMAAAAATGGMSGIITGPGEIQGNLIDAGVTNNPEAAAGFGLAVGALDVLTPLELVHGIMRPVQQQATRGIARRVAGGIAKGAAMEAPTEMAQEELALGAEKVSGVSPVPEVMLSRILNAGVGGAAVGGLFGGGAAIFEHQSHEIQPPQDPQVDQIKNGTPPPPPAPTTTEMFPLEDPQPAEGEAPESAPGQQPAPAPAPMGSIYEGLPALEPVSQPLEMNITPASQDTETYGNPIKEMQETSVGDVKMWKAESGTETVAQTQDGRYQLSSKNGARTDNWVFPTQQEAAFVATNLQVLQPGQRSAISKMSAEDVKNYIYENARPTQAVFKGLDGELIKISNFDHTLRRNSTRLTYKQLDALRSNPRVMQFLTGLQQATTAIRDKVKSSVPVSDVYFLFSPDSNNFGYNRVGQNHIAVNVGTDVFKTKNYGPLGIATSLTNTIIHEMAHNTARGHDIKFAQDREKLSGSLLDKYNAVVVALDEHYKEQYAPIYFQSIQGLARILADPTDNSRVDPRIGEALLSYGERSGETVLREDSPGQSFEQLISGEPQGPLDAQGGDRASIEPRPIEFTTGEPFAQPIWFSRLGRALFGPTGIFGNAKQLSKGQLLAIANSPERYGVRPDEIKWTGYKVWLEGAGEKISRQEAEDWFDKHQVRVEEQILGAASKQHLDELTRLNKIVSAARERLLTANHKRYNHPEFDGEYLAAKEEFDIAASAYNNFASSRQRPRFMDYITPGPQTDYSELLMIWTGDDYQTPHFNANELAHARFNVRETPQGRVLFIEEVQSDWHQRGREQGYTEPSRKVPVFNVRTGQTIAEFSSNDEAIDFLRSRNDSFDLDYTPLGGVYSNKPPLAPFSNSWHELVLKRLIRWAVDHGMDGIAWTPARIQVERYEGEMRGIVQAIQWSPSPVQGNKTVSIDNSYGRMTFNVSPDGIITRSRPEFNMKQLREVVGAEMAAQILSQESGNLQPQDLTIGGEAFKILYDKEIPKFLEKYLKQWGVGLERTKIQTGLPGNWSVRENHSGDWIVEKENGDFFEFRTEEEAIRFRDELLGGDVGDASRTSVPFFPINETLRESALQGQPLLRELPVEARILGAHVQKAIDETGAIEDDIDRENKDNTHADLDKFGRISKYAATLLQNAFRNPHIAPLQNFVQHVQALVGEKNLWKYEGEKVLKDWNRLGKAQMSALANFLFDVTAESDKLRRRLTIEELAEFGRKHNLGEDAQRVYHQIDSTFRSVLEALKQEEMRKAQARFPNPDAWMIEQGKIASEFDKILNRNYFPYARFGNHVVLAVATKDLEYKGRKYRKGNTVHMSTYASNRERNAMLKQAQREFAAVDGITVGSRELMDEAYTFQGFPAYMYKNVVETLNLTPEQADTAKRFFLNLSPSQSFIQHLRKRRGIAGFSTDAQRVFAHYISSAAGHVARAKYSDALQADVNEIKGSAKQAFLEYGNGSTRDQLADYAKKVLDAINNPGSDFGFLRGLIFAHYFAFQPVQAVVNLTQLPIMTFGHLAHKYGHVKAAAALVKAMKTVASGFNMHGTAKWSEWALDGNPTMPQEARDALMRGVKEGFINESFAVEVGSLANGNILESMLPEVVNKIGQDNTREIGRITRDMIELGIAPFRLSEEYNRRVAFLAAHELEMANTQNVESAYKEGRETIQQTMFEYAGWNRILAARAFGNKASMLLIFKSFMQHSLWYFMYGRGRVTSLLMLAMFAGLEGLPGMEDLNELLTSLFSKFGGTRIEPRKILRTYLKTIIDDPDIVMHGAARRSLGLGYMSGIPGWDLSPKLGLGRIVPGLQPILQGSRGELKGDTAMTKALEEWLGVAGAMGMNAGRGLIDMGPEGARWRMQFYPSAIKNVIRTQQALDAGAYTNAQGEPLVKFDQTDPTQMTEVLGQVLGLRPSRLAAVQESGYRATQENAYYIARQQHLMSQLEQAFLSSKKDPEAIAEGRRAIKNYNETMPPPFRMTADQIISGLRARAKNNNLTERGLPTQRRWRQIAEEWKSTYQLQ